MFLIFSLINISKFKSEEDIHSHLCIRDTVIYCRWLATYKKKSQFSGKTLYQGTLFFYIYIFIGQHLCFLFCYLTAGLLRWNIAKGLFGFSYWGNAKMMPQGGHSVASEEGGLGYGCGVCYHHSCNWPAFMTAEKATLCLYSQTRRIMLMIPPQTKVLGLFAMLCLSHYACD